MPKTKKRGRLVEPRLDSGVAIVRCDNKRNLVYAEKRLAKLRAESTLTPEEVEEILELCRRNVEKREQDEMVERT